MCNQKSTDGYSCQLETGHGGPCSRVLWRQDGHLRVYWWPGKKASENIGTLSKPEEVRDAKPSG